MIDLIDIVPLEPLGDPSNDLTELPVGLLSKFSSEGLLSQSFAFGAKNNIKLISSNDRSISIAEPKLVIEPGDQNELIKRDY